MVEPIKLLFGLRTLGPVNHVLDWGPDPQWEWAILLGKVALCKIEGLSALSCALQKRLNRSICRLACGLWPKEAQVQSCSLGGVNVPTWEGTLAPPGEYDWTVHLQLRCGPMSKYFDHLFLVDCVVVIEQCVILLNAGQDKLQKHIQTLIKFNSQGYKSLHGEHV